MKLKFLLILISISSYSSEFSINSNEETILSVSDEVVATNCSPNTLGLISSLQRFNSATKRHLLKFTPNGRSGTIVCSAVTKNNGILSLVFSLRNDVNHPIVDIPLSIPKQSVNNLTDFSNYIQNKIDGFTRIGTSGSVKTENFTYTFIDKFQASAGIYLYKVKVSPVYSKEGFEKLKMISSQILYSHHKDINNNEIEGISNKDTSYLFLMTKNSIDLNTIHNYLR